MISRYWYDPNTGVIVKRSGTNWKSYENYPYFDTEDGWNWSAFRVDVPTKNLVPVDIPIVEGRRRG